jgi:hypothetical protein
LGDTQAAMRHLTIASKFTTNRLLQREGLALYELWGGVPDEVELPEMSEESEDQAAADKPRPVG